ncbi:MAG: hypothetical protein BAA02_08655 [Paenibacillaceae bacterium ZCTH02-B3]|nr:MAG: hypothetical protein BAA02_08655 [Paenibacillaceae bacterium ZCTH02-B3]
MIMMEAKKPDQPDNEVSAPGFGCRPDDGQFLHDGHPDGYGEADDSMSIHAIQRTLELGIQFFYRAH